MIGLDEQWLQNCSNDIPIFEHTLFHEYVTDSNEKIVIYNQEAELSLVLDYVRINCLPVE